LNIELGGKRLIMMNKYLPISESIIRICRFVVCQTEIEIDLYLFVTSLIPTDFCLVIVVVVVVARIFAMLSSAIPIQTKSFFFSNQYFGIKNL
jgi:hypothetical protein